MGEFADDAIFDSLMAECDRQDYRMGMISEEEAYEMGITDEHGRESTGYRNGGKRKVSGPGPCPKCKAPTELKDGQFGEFYGCTRFPTCNGSRNV